MNKEIIKKVKEMEGGMVDALMQLVSIPAVHPVSIGNSEIRKAALIEQMCREAGFDEVTRHDAESPLGRRPNVVAKLKGSNPRASRLWIITHLDVVPVGDLRLWKSDPFKPELRAGRIYGRGTEDNGQDLAASIYAVRALKELSLAPERDICLGIVTDEEMISAYGMKHLLARGLFAKGDLFLVPDTGSPDGSLVEAAEKSLLWLKVHTLGRQAHASMPDKAVNAMEAASVMISRFEADLRRKFNRRDRMFRPPYSSFEPTRRLENVGNINTIPGSDTFFIDCRILPGYRTAEVIKRLETIKRKVEKERGVKIKIEPVQREEATVTDPKSPFIRAAAALVEDVLGVRTRVVGIGGGTCAAFARQKGYPAVVWSKVDGTAHQANEYASVRNLVDDAALFAHACLEL